MRPRVWFGERWITSIFDLFEENSGTSRRCFRSAATKMRWPYWMRSAEAGRVEVHNGTVYRWNRPVYDVQADVPHLRVENRVLPAGPTVVDTMANAAFFAGLVRALANQERPLWTQMSFSAASENFAAGVRHGIAAEVYWPQIGQVSVVELVVRKPLPLAAEGLRMWEVDEAEIGRLLDIIEGRCHVQSTAPHGKLPQ